MPEQSMIQNQLPPPEAAEIVHGMASPILIGSFSLGSELESFSEVNSEDRLNLLLRQLQQLPDLSNRLVALNPEKPDKLTSLKEFEKAGKGWKLHLNFDPENIHSVERYKEVLNKLQDLGAITAYKQGQGGGKAFDQPGKEGTVYVGAKDKAGIVAQFLDVELADILKEPEGDTHVDDISIAGRVMGRFEVYGIDPEFHQYGRDGLPYLKEGFGEALWLPVEQKAAHTAKLDFESRIRLTEKYGKYYTGSDLV